MRVAIVDDEKKELETLQTYLAQYSAENDVKIDVDEFSSGDALLKGYRLIYDILIFDIDMPGTNGIDTARKIREQDENAAILFVTNVAQYAINAFEVEAVDYVIKPIGYYDFAMKFRRAVAWVARRGGRELALETVEGVRRVRVADILYVEAQKHYLVYHLEGRDGTQDELIGRGNIKEYEALLRPYNFCRAHRSFLVNLDHVEDIRGNYATVGRAEIPVGRLYKDHLMQECMRSMRG